MHLYAGDVAGVVADVGSCTARFGSAGEDIPRLVFPSSVGYRAAEDGANESKVAERGAAAAQFYVGTMAMRFPRERMDIRAAMSSGDVGVTDWAVMEAVWEHALTHSMLFADPCVCFVFFRFSCMTEYYTNLMLHFHDYLFPAASTPFFSPSHPSLPPRTAQSLRSSCLSALSHQRFTLHDAPCSLHLRSAAPPPSSSARALR
jgi:hypothetical protein